MDFIEKMANLNQMRKDRDDTLVKLFKSSCYEVWTEAMEKVGRMWDNATDPRVRQIHAEFFDRAVAELNSREKKLVDGSKLQILHREMKKERAKGDAGAIAPLDPEFEAITPTALLAIEPAKGLPNR